MVSPFSLGCPASPAHSADRSALSLPAAAPGRSGCGRRVREASGHEIGDPLIKMEAQLSIEMFFYEPSAEKALVPAHGLASYSAVRRIRATAFVSCSQFLSSASNCFRPWGVSA